jgi:hypothetical protein
MEMMDEYQTIMDYCHDRRRVASIPRSPISNKTSTEYCYEGIETPDIIHHIPIDAASIFDAIIASLQDCEYNVDAKNLLKKEHLTEANIDLQNKLEEWAQRWIDSTRAWRIKV